MIMPRKNTNKGAFGKSAPVLHFEKTNPPANTGEVIGAVLPEVQAMLDTEGLYVSTDPADPMKGHSVFLSTSGRLFAMQVDRELEPSGFLPGYIFEGPFKAEGGGE